MADNAERLLGGDHPFTLTARASLAFSYSSLASSAAFGPDTGTVVWKMPS